MEPFSNGDLLAWIGIPLLIFLARVIDVSLGTMRIIFTARGKRNLAPLLGFVEVFIWVVAISQIMRDLDNFASYLAYAGGFAAGNYVGMWLEERLAIGTLVVRTILPYQDSQSGELAQRLQGAGYGVTIVDGQGANGPVRLYYTIVKRKDLPIVSEIIHSTHPRAFFTVEELRSVKEGIFPAQARRPGLGRGIRKSK
jgi:uncharacterized protein YebE (UPF0316 family)